MQELHDQVKVLFVLEGAFKFYYPIVFCKGKDIPLGSHMGNLVLIDHLCFLHFLNCHYLLSLLVAAHSHFSESPSAYDLERVEIFNSNFRSPINSVIHYGHTIVETALLPCVGSPT